MVGAVIIVFWVLAAIFGELLVPHDIYATNTVDKLLEPNSEYWFGTDRIGRDVFSRVIAGARDILIVAPAATLLGTDPRHDHRALHRLLRRLVRPHLLAVRRRHDLACRRS